MAKTEKRHERQAKGKRSIFFLLIISRDCGWFFSVNFNTKCIHVCRLCAMPIRIILETPPRARASPCSKRTSPKIKFPFPFSSTSHHPLSRFHSTLHQIKNLSCYHRVSVSCLSHSFRSHLHTTFQPRHLQIHSREIIAEAIAEKGCQRLWRKNSNNITANRHWLRLLMDTFPLKSIRVYMVWKWPWCGEWGDGEEDW